MPASQVWPPVAALCPGRRGRTPSLCPGASRITSLALVQHVHNMCINLRFSPDDGQGESGHPAMAVEYSCASLALHVHMMHTIP